MLVLLQDAALETAVVQAAAAVPAIAHRGVRWLRLEGEIHLAVAQLREREPDLAIGFIARDEPSVIDALHASADEASAFNPSDLAQLVAFLDRTELRAQQRGETSRLRVAFAHAERLASLGTLVAGVGHEINNPLSAVLLSIAATQRYVLPVVDAAAEISAAHRLGNVIAPELLERLSRSVPERAQRDVSAILEDVNAAANSIASIVRDLRVFARADDDETPEIVDVPELIDHLLRLLGRDVENHGVITRDYEPQLPQLLIPRSRLTQVLTNLLINAAQAIAEVERPVHEVQISVRTDEEFLAIAIRDTGPGIAREAIDRIFDPFYTTKRKEVGTGLGLSISRTILRKLGGDLTVESVFGEGAAFLCFLPLPTHDAIRTARASIAPMVGKSEASESKSVLVVDDDPRMLRAYARLLNTDHRVVIARDATEAIEMLESGTTADVMVLEVDLPARDGVRLLQWIRRQQPALVDNTVIVTAADAEIRHAQTLSTHTGPILYKPIRGEALLMAIAALPTHRR